MSFSVAPGEMFGLIGPDGAGKTTSIRADVRTAARRRRQRFACSASDPVTDHRAITASVGYLSQRFSLYGDLSIDENIAFFAEIHGVRDYHGRRDRLLEMTQLTPFRGRLADQLSGGMKQKLALACTLVHEPQVIVLDEPTTGVDPVSRREFWKLLSQFLAQGITILMSTPYLDEAERCARIALLHEGRLLALDEPGRAAREPAGHAARSARAIAARSARQACRPADWPARRCSAIACTCGSTAATPRRPRRVFERRRQRGWRHRRPAFAPSCRRSKTSSSPSSRHMRPHA